MLVLGVAAATGRATPARAQSSALLQSLGNGPTPAGDLSGLSLSNPEERADLLAARNVELLGTGPVDPATYVLGPGDLLGLEVMGAFSLSAEDLIGADGAMTFPQLGTFQLGGLTLTEARGRVRERARGIIPGASLHLVLKATRAFKVYVVGRVGTPGVVRATAMTRVSEVIEAAGGLRKGAALRGIQVVSPDRSSVTTDLLPFLLRGSLEGNPTLVDGAVVLVPPATAVVEVLGAVRRPGTYDFLPGDDLGTLLGVIGLAPAADSSRVVIQRFPVDGASWDTLSVALEPVLRGVTRVPLRARDRILVRARGAWETEAVIQVRGAVARPGPLPVVRGGIRVAEAVALAGGALEGALLERVLVHRPLDADSVRVSDPSRGRKFVQGLAARRAREAVADLTRGPGPVVEPGDVITVPRRYGYVQVLGQVKMPGFYDYHEEWSPKDYIHEAGGYGRQADKSQARVTRGNHGEVLFAADVNVLAPGDLIWVPERRPKNFWETVRNVASLTTSAITIFLLIREANR